MESLTENKPLLYSLFISGGAITALASGVVPEFSEQFELVHLPPEVSKVLSHPIYSQICTCPFLKQLSLYTWRNFFH